MEYNKKEQLFDEINGLRLTSTNASDTLYNRGVVDAFRRTNEFFGEELIPEVPQYVIDWYEENKDSLDYNLWNLLWIGMNKNLVSLLIGSIEIMKPLKLL